jgi:hypothetical protein
MISRRQRASARVERRDQAAPMISETITIVNFIAVSIERQLVSLRRRLRTTRNARCVAWRKGTVERRAACPTAHGEALQLDPLSGQVGPRSGDHASPAPAAPAIRLAAD